MTTTYSVAEAAEQLGVTERWLADRVRAGKVPHVRFGRQVRFTTDQVEAVLADHIQDVTAAAPSAWGQTAASRRRTRRAS